MTFPTIPTVAAGRVLTSLGTTCASGQTFPNLSSLTKNAGDLLIAIVGIYDGNSTNAEFSSWGGGFTEFGDFSTTTTSAIGCAYKWSTGSETGTFTVTSADTSTNDYWTILLSIPGAHPTTPPEAGGYATFTGANVDPGLLNPAGWGTEDTLWIAVGSCNETSLTGSYTGVEAAPANYTGYVGTGISADVVGGVSGAVAFRQLNAASEDPGAFTCDTSNVREAGITIAVRPAPAAQTLTQSSSFSDSDGLTYAHTVTPGAVALTQTARLDNANGLAYAHSISQPAAGQDLTQTAGHDNSNGLAYAHTLATTIDLAQSARPDNAATYYAHSLTPGAVALAQTARHDSIPTFPAHALAQDGGDQTLMPTAPAGNSPTFYAHTLTPGEVALAQSARPDNAATFYAHTLTPGAVALAQTARHDSAAAFYTHALVQPGGAQALTQAGPTENSQEFYAHALAQEEAGPEPPAPRPSASGYVAGGGHRPRRPLRRPSAVAAPVARENDEALLLAGAL